VLNFLSLLHQLRQIASPRNSRLKKVCNIHGKFSRCSLPYISIASIYSFVLTNLQMRYIMLVAIRVFLFLGCSFCCTGVSISLYADVFIVQSSYECESWRCKNPSPNTYYKGSIYPNNPPINTAMFDCDLAGSNTVISKVCVTIGPSLKGCMTRIPAPANTTCQGVIKNSNSLDGVGCFVANEKCALTVDVPADEKDPGAGD
jgi:hypothetical protein